MAALRLKAYRLRSSSVSLDPVLDSFGKKRHMTMTLPTKTKPPIMLNTFVLFGAELLSSVV